jgi:FkbM family methyltransferase
MLLLKQAIKYSIKPFGFDLVRSEKNPELTLLGITDLPIDVVIDVGANSGQFAKKIAPLFPDAQLYCFEPLTEPFEELRCWADTKSGRVTVFNKALGDIEGNVEMFLHQNHTASSSMLKTTELTKQYYPATREQRRVKVRQETMDSLLLDKLDNQSGILVKLDVQGYEDKVIAGGTALLKSALACIVEVSIDGLYENQTSFSTLLSSFEQMGYRYGGNLEQVYASDGHTIYFDCVFLNKNLIAAGTRK